MRIGIHMGKLMGGVIGTKRLRYDIWGASYMAATALESGGVSGEVCVSEDVLRHLKGSHAHVPHKCIKLKAALPDGATSLQSYRLVPPGHEATSCQGGRASPASTAASTAANTATRPLQPLGMPQPLESVPTADPLDAATDHSLPAAEDRFAARFTSPCKVKLPMSPSPDHPSASDANAVFGAGSKGFAARGAGE
jgi:hypothetical protein